MQVTYIAPDGDADHVVMGGFTFHDGISVEVPADDRIAPALLKNRYFIVEIDDEPADEPDSEDAPRRRGRPRKSGD